MKYILQKFSLSKNLIIINYFFIKIKWIDKNVDVTIVSNSVTNKIVEK